MRNDRLALCLLVVGAACSSLAAVPARADDEKSAVSPNRLKLPKGPGSLEGVGENVEPNLSMGLMSYGIPIDLPAGHNGHSPSLRLAYSSGAGNSAVGIGWSLAVPSIERMTVRGLPRYGADDLVAAGGSDELVAVERAPDHIVYRARFEGGFVRYTWFNPGSGGYWLAEYPDGKRAYFGATHDGRTVDTANVSGGLGTFRWQLVELLDTLDHRVVYEYERNLYGDSRLRTIRWVERADGTFRYGVRLDYEGRRDEISDAKPGFDLRCDLRVSRVTVLNDGRQMRAWGLHYDDAAGLSKLARVERFGTQNARPFPVVFTFAYTGGLGDCDGEACQVPRMGTIAGGLPGAFADGDADFIDINGDSLPDILDTSGPRHAFRLNGGEFDGVLAFGGSDPSDLDVSVSLGDPGVQPLDVDGNGTSDLIFGRGADARVLWNRGGGDWAAEPEPIDAANLPDFGAAGDAFRFIDVDHDRRIDLLFSSAGATEVLFNRNAAGGIPGFGAAELTEDAIGYDFSANGVQLADMNGDALADPVFRTDSGASYLLNLGRGRFSDWIPMATEDQDDIPDSAQFVDLNGDGLSDLVSVESSAVRVWLNQNGRSFDAPLLIDDGVLAGQGAHIPEADLTPSHRFLDINGNGSTDVVWVRPGGESVYLDLFPVRPNLLATIDNGIGDTIAMTYGNSTAHALEEGADSRLPSPGITVDRIVRTTEQVTEDWVAPHEQFFHYAEGLYDGLEHQFRGFERVRVETPGDADTEGSRADHVFDVGRTDVGSAPDAYRKGLLISRDVFSGEGLTARLIERTESTYGDCDLAGVPAETDPPIRWVCQRSTAKTHIETPPADAAQMPAPDPVRTEENYAYDRYGNRIRTEKLGVVARNEVACGAACAGDELYEETTFVAPDRTGGRWLLRAPCVARTYGRPGSPQQTETRTYYDDPPELGAPECTLTRGLKARGTQKRFEDRDETVTSERNTYDAHGNVIVTRDANGHRRTFAYDADALLPVAETAWLDDAGRAAPYGLVTRVSYDRTLDLVDTSVDWRIVRDDAEVTPAFTTRYRYDEFGRLTSIQHPDDRELPSETWTYDLRAPVSRIVKQARTQLGGGFDLAQVQCFDGRGRAFGSLGLVSPGRYLATGVTRPNVLSGAAESFQPFETNTDACTAAPAGVLSTRWRYDGQGRLLGTLEPDGSTTRTEYRPLEVAAFDEEDTDQNSRQHFNTPTRTFTDGLGRTVRIERIADRDRDPIPLRLTYDELGRLRGYIDAEDHEKVQTYDLLGRVLRVDDPDSGRTTFDYDAVGNRLATQDARGATVRTEFDELNRPVAEYATWPAAGEVRADTEVRTAYDDEAACEDFAQGAGTCTHAAGRTVRVTYPLFGWPRDGAAAAATGEDVFGYDARGQAVRTVRRLDRHVFEFETRYDSAGRVVANTYPDGERVDQTLDGLGRLVAVPGYIDAVDYNTQGLPTRITHVGGLSERHAYDQRLREVAYGADSAAGGAIVSRTLTRTPTGNIVGIADALARADAPSGNAQYTYDSLYRLTSARLDSGAPSAEQLEWTYDDLDRINAATSDRPDSRAHVGRYTYGEGPGPNAVTSTDDDRGNITRYRYDDAGFMTLHGQDAYLWDARGRMTLVRRGAAELGNNIYGPGVDRVAVRKGNHVSAWYPHPAFEVRDGVTTKYVSLGTRRVVKIERADQAARWLSDLAPATVDLGVASPVGDAAITGADAWMALAAAVGVLDLPEETRTDDVDALLQAAARRVALRDAPRVTRLLHDHLGTLIATTDARGGLLTRVEHYPYGLERWSSDGRGDDYEYTGKEYDADTGLTYFGARYLEPRLGRWVSPDPKFVVVPVDAADSATEQMTRFAFARLRPTRASDPDGQSSVVYDGETKTLTVYDRNGTAVMTLNAHNNVAPLMKVDGKQVPTKGPIESGTYNFMDKSRAHKHGSEVGSDKIKKDSANGMYGEGGVFRLEGYTDSRDVKREGIAIHAGRAANPNFNARKTYGCIRLASDADFKKLADYVANDPLTTLDVKNGKAPKVSNQSTNSSHDDAPMGQRRAEAAFNARQTSGTGEAGSSREAAQ